MAAGDPSIVLFFSSSQLRCDHPKHRETLIADWRVEEGLQAVDFTAGRSLGKAQAPKYLARSVHELYFEPNYAEFRSRTIWSLSNAFTSTFKELEPIPQFKATANLGEFLETRFSQSF